jgi:HAD superfamily hydrolase (TIGR01509 family)
MYKKEYGVLLSKHIIKKVKGLRDKEEFSFFKKKYNIDEPIENMIKKRDEYFFKYAKHHKILFDGTLNMISKLKKHYALAITTSGYGIKLDFKLSYINKKDFKVIVDGTHVSKGKPNPECYLLTIKKLKLKPEECVVIEDALNGVASAKKAGVKCIAVETSFSKNRLKKAGADLVIKDISKLNKELIDKLGEIND